MDSQRSLLEVYQESLRRHAHELIAMGYQELHAAEFQESEEEDITGEIVQAMKEIQDRDNVPDWIVNYSIHENPPLNVPGKRGKRRPRVDIQFEPHIAGKKPLFSFEAKRLGKNHGVSQYLGQEGLGCFTSGKYPLTHPEAGMLGYVQNQSELTWGKKIGASLRKDPTRYQVSGNPSLRRISITPELPHTYQSTHHCNPRGEDILIFHTLLRFYS